MAIERTPTGIVGNVARITVIATALVAYEGGQPAPTSSSENSPLVPFAAKSETPDPTDPPIKPVPTLVYPTLTPTEIPLIACRYQDLITPLTNYDDWKFTLVDTNYALPRTYAPKDLVSTRSAGLSGGTIRSIVIPDLKDLTAAARKAGVSLAAQSTFRSYTTQISTFNYWTHVSNYKSALLASARPGHSEHQLGTTIDFRGANDSAPWKYRDWAKTKTGAWMAANAWKYGFIMSYPAGKSPSKTCYQYEPWHYRYVGRVEAAEIHSSRLSPREWLWQHQPNQ